MLVVIAYKIHGAETRKMKARKFTVCFPSMIMKKIKHYKHNYSPLLSIQHFQAEIVYNLTLLPNHSVA